VAEDDEILVCDDLGDEWADFIGIDARSQPQMISFYHAKHGDVSLSASAFHVAVSQAIKNLGHMNLTDAAIEGKTDKWISPYVNSGVETAIPRFARGDMAAMREQIGRIATSPDTIRRTIIVASSLSYAALIAALQEIQNGERPRAHFVQLYWLLTGFFSACLEMSIIPYVVCRT
jgi:hypothetical protein